MIFKKYFPAIIWLILSLILINFFLLPVAFRIKNNLSLMVSEENNLKLLKERKENFQDFQQKEGFYRNILQTIDNYFNPEFNRLLESKNLNSKINPLKIRRDKDDFWPVKGFNLILEGDYSDFLRFLTEIEEKLIEIVHLEIKENGQKITVSLIVKTFIHEN